MSANNNPMVDQEARSTSILMIDFLIITGLVTEFFALSFIIIKEKIIPDEFPIYLIMFCLGVMLIHHFFIIRNFHKIDHMTKNEKINNGFGNWVIRSRIENILRLALFGLFACLTGEISYLVIVYHKDIDLMNNQYLYDNPITHILEPKKYDLTWITNFYIKSAFFMASLMLIWDVFGKFYDTWLRPLSDDDRIAAKQNGTGHSRSIGVIAFPFKDPFWVFFISDAIAWIMWLSLKSMVLDHNENSKYLIITLFSIYAIFIGIRTFGSFAGFKPKIKKTCDYWKTISLRKILDEL